MRLVATGGLMGGGAGFEFGVLVVDGDEEVRALILAGFAESLPAGVECV